MIAACRTVRTVALGLWAGGAIFFSFLTTPRIFHVLRDQLPHNPPPGVAGLTPEVGLRLAGDTVGAVFPSYFAAQIAVGAMAVGAGLLAGRHGRWSRSVLALSIVALAIVTLHGLTVYPHSTRILDEHYQAADAGDAARAASLRKTFGMWHGVSQMLNLVAILTVVVALVLAALPADDRAASAATPLRPWVEEFQAVEHRATGENAEEQLRLADQLRLGDLDRLE